jgi:Flp pilus assembly pilin Flp
MRALDYGLIAAVIGLGLIFLGHLVELMWRV